MSQSHRAKICICAAGVGNVLLLAFGAPTALTLSVAVFLAPLTLFMALQLTVFVACGVLSFALGDGRDRAELLVYVISAMFPGGGSGEKYSETMISEVRVAPPEQIWPIALNLTAAAPRTIFDAWVRLPRPLWGRWRRGARR